MVSHERLAAFDGMTEVRILGAGDEAVLENVAEGVFDHPVQRPLAAEFLADTRHHLAVALDAGCVVGAASAVHYIHPDKPPELWINEVGVARTHRRTGLGRRLLQTLRDHAQELGCGEAWVLTERVNAAAMKLYSSVGGVEHDDTVMFSFDVSHRHPD